VRSDDIIGSILLRDRNMQSKFTNVLAVAACGLSVVSAAYAQNIKYTTKNGVEYTAPPPPKGLAPPGTPFDKHDISGKWNRVSPFET
jgi:hypothetical protein